MRESRSAWGRRKRRGTASSAALGFALSLLLSACASPEHADDEVAEDAGELPSDSGPAPVDAAVVDPSDDAEIARDVHTDEGGRAPDADAPIADASHEQGGDGVGGPGAPDASDGAPIAPPTATLTLRTNGLAGRGLTLRTASGIVLSDVANGARDVEVLLTQIDAADVLTVLTQPVEPRQTCVLVRADVRALDLTCTTSVYTVGGTVLGLEGSGLVLSLSGGETVAIASDGAFRFASELPDGSAFTVSVASAPSAPAQGCTIAAGQGTLHGRDVRDVSVRCGALGTLRISEVGSCYFIDTACWLEVYNAGPSAEELSLYTLRAPAWRRTAPYGDVASYSFALPSMSVAPGAYVVVQANSHGALADGGGVVHVDADAYVPWWQDTGALELVSAERTVDFVRFGDSQIAPLTSDAWTGTSVLGLPSGAYGYAIARDITQRDSDRPVDWTPRAFSTPGGPNDVTSDVDADADGIPDTSEQPGSRFAGLDLYAFGARAGIRDLFVEIDRMESSEPALTPRREALDKLVSVFARRGIALHPDVGSVFTTSVDPAQYNLGGGNTVPFATAIDFGPTAAPYADFYAYKAAHMTAARRSVFYYMLFAWSQERDGRAGSSGVGEVLGNDSIITLGGWGLDDDSSWQRNQLANYQASTMMHELGHNLSLLHGGDDGLNQKPNYLSVMNYMYSLIGLPTIGTREGDRYQLYFACPLLGYQLTRPPTGDPAQFQLDFSSGGGLSLDERSIVDNGGLGRSGSGSVDYDCDGQSDGPYALDVNHDGALGVLRDHDDWSNLDFVFRRSYSGNENGPRLSALTDARVVAVPEDTQVDDRQRVVADPCPSLATLSFAQ